MLCFSTMSPVRDHVASLPAAQSMVESLSPERSDRTRFLYLNPHRLTLACTLGRCLSYGRRDSPKPALAEE
jgi:hypothetical protein